jgi:hypothetical protein
VVELAERAITEYMKEAKFGAIIYNSWTKDSIHYIGNIGSFMTGYNVHIMGKATTVTLETELVL